MEEDIEGTAVAVAVVLTLGGRLGVVGTALMIAADEVVRLPEIMTLLVGQ